MPDNNIQIDTVGALKRFAKVSRKVFVVTPVGKTPVLKMKFIKMAESKDDSVAVDASFDGTDIYIN